MENQFLELFDRQADHFQSDATKSIEWRIEQLDRMARMLDENREELCEALFADFRKPRFEQMVEINVPLGVVNFYRDNLEDLMRPEEVEIPSGLAATGHKGVIYKEPYGVTLVIGPFNAPILLLLDPAIAALAAGNPVILKPANSTPHTADILSKLIPKYFSPECVSIVTGGREEITDLLRLPFDFIFFTGSTAVGKIVMRAAAEHLTPVILELGGQNPTIVDETANIEIAAERIVWGHNAIAGQWCVSPGYVCAHESIADQLVDAMRKSIARMYGNDPQRSPDFARLISEQDAERVRSYILNDKVIAGGEADIGDRYVAPTILYPTAWEDPAMQQEIFGPVLPVLSYTDLKALMRKIKAKPKPLAAYVFSKRQKNIDNILHSLSFGGGCVNQTNIQSWVDSLPFGGVGLSGMGKYYGKAGFDALSNSKAMLIGNPDEELDIFPPYAEKDLSKVLAPFQ